MSLSPGWPARSSSSGMRARRRKACLSAAWRKPAMKALSSARCSSWVMAPSEADGLVDDRPMFAELAVGDEGPQHVDDDTDTEQRGDVGGIVGRRYLDDLHP